MIDFHQFSRGVGYFLLAVFVLFYLYIFCQIAAMGVMTGIEKMRKRFSNNKEKGEIEHEKPTR